MELIYAHSHQNKKSEVLREDDGTYTVVFYSGGVWSHQTTSNNVNEAKRLAENYIASKTTLLTE